LAAQLGTLQRESCGYFEHEVNPANGLVDNTIPTQFSKVLQSVVSFADWLIERGEAPRTSRVPMQI
jgi:hypothetical protein